MYKRQVVKSGNKMTVSYEDGGCQVYLARHGYTRVKLKCGKMKCCKCWFWVLKNPEPPVEPPPIHLFPVMMVCPYCKYMSVNKRTVPINFCSMCGRDIKAS